ncbi:Hypothetical predicted protein, partial [Paramuricea clavata]
KQENDIWNEVYWLWLIWDAKILLNNGHAEPISPRAYIYHTKAVLHATKDVAESTMKQAVGKLHNLKSNHMVRMEFLKLLYHVMVPGKEGDSLRYMVVFPVISMETAKILDVEPLKPGFH